GDELASLHAMFPRAFFLTLSAYHIFANKCKVHELHATFGDRHEALLVTEGWGLPINSQESASVLSQEYGSDSPKAESSNPVAIPEWLQHISNEQEDVYQLMVDAKIFDDNTYLLYEHHLPMDARILAGRIRFNF